MNRAEISMPSSLSEARRALSLPPVRPPSPVRSERPVRSGLTAVVLIGPSSPKMKELAISPEVTVSLVTVPLVTVTTVTVTVGIVSVVLSVTITVVTVTGLLVIVYGSDSC